MRISTILTKCGIYASLSTLIVGCQINSNKEFVRQLGSNCVKFSDGKQWVISYYPDGLPKALFCSNLNSQQVQLRFFDFNGDTLINQDTEGVVKLTEQPLSFYSQYIQQGAHLPQPVILTVEPDIERKPFNLDCQYYIDDEGGVNLGIWALSRSGLLDKATVRCVLKENVVKESLDVVIDSERIYGDNLKLKCVHIDSGNLVFEYMIKLMDGEPFYIRAKLPLIDSKQKGDSK